MMVVVVALWPWATQAGEKIPVVTDVADVPAVNEVIMWKAAGAEWTPFSASSTSSTADTIPVRNTKGELALRPVTYTVATIPACTTGEINERLTVTDGMSRSSCTIGGGGYLVDCVCNGNAWVSLVNAAPTMQETYNTSAALEKPVVLLGKDGVRQTGQNSLQKAEEHCNGSEWLCEKTWIDDSGVAMRSPTKPAILKIKPFPGLPVKILTSTGADALVFSSTGAGTIATSLAGTGSGTVTANRTSCTGTDILKADGTCMTDVVRVADKQVGDTATTNPVSNTITKTTIYSFPVPANKLGTDSCYRFEVNGHLLNNFGAGQNVTIRAEYKTTVGAATSVSLSQSASSRSVRFAANLCGSGATNSQRMWLHWDVNGFTPVSASSGPAEDSTTTGNFLVTLEFATADLNITYTPYYARSEFLP